MEIIMGTIICIESCFIVYFLTKRENTEKPNIEQRELERQERIDKSFRELMAYNEHIAIKGKGNN